MTVEFLAFTAAICLGLPLFGAVYMLARKPLLVVAMHLLLATAFRAQSLANRMYHAPGLTSRGMRVVNVLDRTARTEVRLVRRLQRTHKAILAEA